MATFLYYGHSPEFRQQKRRSLSFLLKTFSRSDQICMGNVPTPNTALQAGGQWGSCAHIRQHSRGRTLWVMCPHPGEHYTQEGSVDQEDRLRSHQGNTCVLLSRKKGMRVLSPKEQIACGIMIFVGTGCRKWKEVLPKTSAAFLARRTRRDGVQWRSLKMEDREW